MREIRTTQVWVKAKERDGIVHLFWGLRQPIGYGHAVYASGLGLFFREAPSVQTYKSGNAVVIPLGSDISGAPEVMFDSQNREFGLRTLWGAGTFWCGAVSITTTSTTFVQPSGLNYHENLQS